MHRATTPKHDERGAAAVELAIVLPILILLVFGIIQFSIYFNRLQGLQAAAREGARVAALPQSTQSDIRAGSRRARRRAAGRRQRPPSPCTPSTGNPCDLKAADARVVVTVTANTDLDIPLLGSQTVTLTGKGEFKCE